MPFVKGQLVRIQTDTVFDGEGIPVSVRTGTLAMVAADEKPGDEFVDVVSTLPNRPEEFGVPPGKLTIEPIVP